MPIPLLSAANLSAGKKEKGKHLVFLCYQQADRSRKRQGWRWVCVSLCPIKGYCSVLSTADSLYCHIPLWQALFICFRSAGGPYALPWGHRSTCTTSKSRKARWLQSHILEWRDGCWCGTIIVFEVKRVMSVSYVVSKPDSCSCASSGDGTAK